MGQEKDKIDAAFRETRILIANSRIASSQAALTRVISEIERIMSRKEQIEKELNEFREMRDSLLIEGWDEGKPDWTLLLGVAGRSSATMLAKATEETEKLDLFIAGEFNRIHQKALGIALTSDTSNQRIEKLALSLKTVFPYLLPLADSERAVIVAHSSPESFSLEIRQNVLNYHISVAVVSYGSKFSAFFNTFSEAIYYIRECMTGNRFTIDLRADLN
ncbi:hypothetical protein ACI0X9_003298 [Cronobacter turicensis]